LRTRKHGRCCCGARHRNGLCSMSGIKLRAQCEEPLSAIISDALKVVMRIIIFSGF
jgi:hypothetical protein